MQCSCGRQVRSGDQFCPGCGRPLTGQSYTINNSRNKVAGNQYQAGRDIYLSSDGSSSKPQASYEAVPVWRSPFTQAVLSWIGVITGILGLIPSARIIGNVFNLPQLVSSNALDSSNLLAPLVSLVVLFFICIGAIKLREIAQKQIRVPIPFVQDLAMSGRGHRINVERIAAEMCPICNGRLKYYSKPVESGGKKYPFWNAHVIRNTPGQWIPLMQLYRTNLYTSPHL